MIVPTTDAPQTSGIGAVDPGDLNILGRVTRADIRLEPYPHVLIHDALPQALFDALAAAFPSLDYVARDQASLNNKSCLRGAAEVIGDPLVAPIWQQFFDFHLSRAFFDAFCDLWGDTVARVHPGIEQNFGKPLREFTTACRSPGKGTTTANRQTDLVLDCVFGINTPVRAESAVRGAHVDSPFKLFSSLLYFRDPEDASEGGEYELYRIRRRMYPRRLLKKIPDRYVDPVARVPYRANTLMFWLNSAGSVHGVTPRKVTPMPRRYVSVMGECYGGRAADGYFLHDPQWTTPAGRLRTWLNV